MRRRLAPLALLAATALGCGGAGPREAPFPRFDLMAPFTEHGTLPAATGAAARTAAIQAVALGGRFAADLPFAYDEWRAVTDGRFTLAAHTPAGGEPDVLVVAEAFSNLMAASPSRELARFRRSVAPGLDRLSPLPADQRPLAVRLAASSGAPARDVAGVLEALASRTAGRGLGFRPEPRSFAGWSWIGKAPAGVELRLARAEGLWGAPPPLAPEIEAAAGRLAEASPRLASWAAAAAETPLQSRRDRAALLVFGTASTGERFGVHLAILCAAEPECAQAPQLARFLGSIRRDNGGAPHSGAGDLEGLAVSLGIVLVSEADVPAPAELAPPAVESSRRKP